jgi:hypothetical protein
VEDLWPGEIENVEVKAPVVILREQAALLGSKTKNIVEAKITKYPLSIVKRDFQFGFFLRAPALSGYTYSLFSIAHDISLYPVDFFPDDDIWVEFRQMGFLETETDSDGKQDNVIRAYDVFGNLK